MSSNPSSAPRGNTTAVTASTSPAPRAAGVAGPRAAEESAGEPGGWVQGWVRFWFTAINPRGLHAVRILAGLVFLAWLAPLTPDRAALFRLDGLFDRAARLQAGRLTGGPPAPLLDWSLTYLGGGDPFWFEVVWWGSLAVLVLFTLGIATRLTAPLTWVVVTSFLTNPAIHADVDFLMPILALYLALGYLLLGQWNRSLTPVERLLGPRGTSIFARWRRGDDEDEAPSYAANLALRLMQVHFALIVVTSALHKFQFGDWWAGVAWWYPLHRPSEMTAELLQRERPGAATTLFVLSLLAYVAWAWALTFPLFAFRRARWARVLLLGGAAAAWLGSVIIYRDPTFGPFFVVCCLSYLTPEEWRWAALPWRWLARSATVEGEAAGAGRRPRVKAAP